MAKVTALSSLGWAHYTLYEALPRMAARGFKRIEVASFGTYCFHFNSGSPTPGELRHMLDDLVGQIGAKHGVKMLLEIPHLYGIMPRPEQVLWVFDHLSCPNVGALVDCSHWGVIGYDVDELFSALGNRLWHIHLRDSAGPDTADKKQKLEMTPGDGIVDFKRFAQALDKANYKGDVTIEFEYRDMTLDAIEREYDRGLKYLENVGWELPAGVKRR